MKGIVNTDKFRNETDYLSIPKSIIAYDSRVLYESYTVLENQLSQINPDQNREMYNGLDQLTQTIFNSWVLLGRGHMEGFGRVPTC